MFLVKKNFFRLFAFFTAMFFISPVRAAGPPAANPLNNELAVLLISVMIILLIAIGILATILIGAADVTVLKRKKEKAKKQVVQQAAAIFIGFMLLSPAMMAQNNAAPNAVETVSTIGGLSASSFYIMVSIIFLELLVVLVLLINIRLLLRSQKKTLVMADAPEAVAAMAKPKLSWWNWFNKLKPIEQEADIDLGHDYDGIRELDNRLPPWWLYGFYATIIIGAIYLWRYHVSHTAPLSKEEYEIAVQKGEQQKNAYLKAKGESIDENTVAMLGTPDIEEGKKIFTNPAKCAMCHGADASGIVNGNPGVGPNLTDNYWIHGGDIKSVFKTIKYGIGDKGMPEWKSTLTAKQMAQLASFVKSLKGSNPAKAKAPDGQLYIEDGPKPAADSAAKKDNKVAAN